MREVQKKKLEETGFGQVETKWWGSVGEVPKSEDEFTVVVAHEFFDAMPIHIFEVSQIGQSPYWWCCHADPASDRAEHPPRLAGGPR